MTTMLELVERFPAQLTEAIQIGEAAHINKSATPIRNVFVSGLGGSGIGGNFVQELVRSEIKVPFTVSKSYDIPAFINKFTLVILSSYSGNTEETLSAFDLALKTGAKIVCITSGGKMLARAKELKLDYVQLPDNWPSPRACLGFSLVQQLYVLHKLKLISSRIIRQLPGATALIAKNQESFKKEGLKLAQQLNGKLPVIYTTDKMESVAVRFRQQLNENSKSLGWSQVIPEMNHNELVGWTGDYNQTAVVFLRTKDDYSRNAVRIDIIKKIMGEHTKTIVELMAKGKNDVEQRMYLVHLCDFASVYLSALRNHDSMEIKVIDFLKGELAKV